MNPLRRFLHDQPQANFGQSLKNPNAYRIDTMVMAQISAEMTAPPPIDAVPPADKAWWRSMSTDDVDAHSICQPGWELNYEQLSAGHFRGLIDHVHLPGLSLLREGANRGMRQFGQMSLSGYGVAVPLAIEGEAFFSGQRVSMRSAMVGPSDDLDLSSQGSFLMSGVIADAQLMRRYYERIFDHSPGTWFDRQIALDLGANERMRVALRTTFQALTSNPGMLDDTVACGQLRDALLLECLALLPEQFDAIELKTIAVRRKIFERACELIHSHSAEPLSLLQLCNRVGASERKLNYCFQDVVGMSPGRYLRAVRLNGVRRALKDPGNGKSGVQDLAARWGFWHLGQFSSDYKRQFGELPSATLRRAREAIAAS